MAITSCLPEQRPGTRKTTTNSLPAASRASTASSVQKRATSWAALLVWYSLSKFCYCIWPLPSYILLRSLSLKLLLILVVVAAIEPQSAICGNGVVEAGEECDCGWEEDCKEKCCYPMRSVQLPNEKPCTLRRHTVCSPSQVLLCLKIILLTMRASAVQVLLSKHNR